MNNQHNYSIFRKNLKFFKIILRDIETLTIINDDIIVNCTELYEKFIDLIIKLIDYYNRKSLSVYELKYDIIYVDDIAYGIKLDYYLYNQNLKKYIILYSHDIIFEKLIIKNNLKQYYKWLNSNS